MAANAKYNMRVAVVQASSVVFKVDATLAKLEKLCKQASDGGAQLALFPEAFIPCYPHGTYFNVFNGFFQEGRENFSLYWESAVEIPGPIIDKLSAIARENNLHLIVGVMEREGGTLYCTVIFFGDDGKYLGKHRKLMPTTLERVIWDRGDGSTLPVFNTRIGKIGAVICWENYMPLLRMTMYSKGVQIYCAPTADSGDEWLASMRHIALEGRCFVLTCNQYLKRSDYPPSFFDPKWERLASKSENDDFVVCRGGSCIIGPWGEVLAGPNYEEETILYADIDLNDVVKAKFDFDVVGHYARPDVFTLHVNEKPNHNVVFHQHGAFGSDKQHEAHCEDNDKMLH